MTDKQKRFLTRNGVSLVLLVAITLLMMPLDMAGAQRRGGGGGGSFGRSGGSGFGRSGGSSSFGGRSGGSSSFGGSSSSSNSFNRSNGGSFGRSGSYGSNGISRSTSANRGGSYAAGGNRYYAGGHYYPTYQHGGFWAGYSLGYWSSPSWYYYTPFHPAFYISRPYIGPDGMAYGGGLNFLNMFLGFVTLIVVMFVIFGLMKMMSGRNRGVRYNSY